MKNKKRNKGNIFLVLLATIFLSFTFNQDNDYFTLFEGSNNIKYFKYGKHTYYEFFLNDKENINGTDYYVEVKTYSWGKIDTTYYRKGDKYYYHYDKKNNKESIVVPIAPKVGETWYESDKSWKYEITKIDEKFKTPAEKYRDCMLVKCEQLTNRDKNKSQVYYLYYSKKYGYVGNVNSKGKILSYLKEMKINAKEGDKVGGE